MNNPTPESNNNSIDNNIVLKATKGLDFNSKLSFIGAGVGLAYAIFSGKSKFLWTALGALSGAVITTITKK